MKNESLLEHTFTYKGVDYLQLEDAAGYTSMNAATIYARIKRGLLEPLQRNRSVFIKLKDCHQLAEYQNKKDRRKKIRMILDSHSEQELIEIYEKNADNKQV